MKFDIIVNKYLLMWHLLFQSSISQDIHDAKQKIWTSKRNKYIDLKNEKDVILRDLDNYIPDDDEVFDILENSSAYKKIKQETNRYRLMLLEIWDKNKKLYFRELGKILKYDLKGDYKICILHPSLGVAEVDFVDNKVITIGKKLSIKEKDDFLTYLMYKIIKNDVLNVDTKEIYILNSVIELAITNELYTRVTGDSKYSLGKKELRGIKEKIYPYWLMYLGISKDNMEKHMLRDNILFNINAYNYINELSCMSIFDFINYIIDNKKEIFSKKKEKLELIEEL